MNLNYLQEVLLPQREQEIKEGKNLATAQPIYVVLDPQENIVEGHTDFTPLTNNKGLQFEFGYVDMGSDSEYREFSETDDGMEDPLEVSRFYTDRFVAFFLTSKAAHDYLEYQSHNLSDLVYVYVFYSGYANKEMDLLLNNE